MSTTGMTQFDHTIHETNIWLKEIMDQIGPDRQRAYHALRSTLHTLRDRLPVDEAAHLGAQLPMLVRGIYYEGWRPAHKPDPIRSRDEFLERIAERFQTATGPLNPDDAAKAVFRTLINHVTPGEVEDVIGALPKDMRGLFTAAQAAGE